VLTELLVTLDLEKGGEVASNLAALYTFLLGELVQVGVRTDLARLDRVTRMIAELREAFAQVSSTPVAASVSA
jgi:flagellar protein FliS